MQNLLELNRAVTYDEEILIKEAQKTMELFEGQLVLCISDEIASNGLLERVELVNDLVNEFNAKH